MQKKMVHLASHRPLYFMHYLAAAPPFNFILMCMFQALWPWKRLQRRLTTSMTCLLQLVTVFIRVFFDYHLTVVAARKLPKQQQPAANAQPTVEPGVSGCFFEAFFSLFFLFPDTAFQAAASKGKSGCC
jgi:hypothetical protein